MIARVVAVGSFVMLAGIVGYGVGVHSTPIEGWSPSETANVTCYKWVENGSAQVACPSVVGAGDGLVYIDVKPCSEYEYKIDESAPCDAEQGGESP